MRKNGRNSKRDNNHWVLRTNAVYRAALEELYGVLGPNWRSTSYPELAKELGITLRQSGRFMVLMQYLEICEYQRGKGLGWRITATLDEARQRFEVWADQRAHYGGDMDDLHPTKEESIMPSGPVNRSESQRETALRQFVDGLSGIYGLVPMSPQEIQTSYQKIGDELGMNHHAAIQLKMVLEQAGILGTRVTYGDRENSQGRTSYWTLLVPEDEGQKRLEAWNAKRRKTPGSLDSILYPNRNPKVSAGMKRKNEERKAILARAKELAAQPAKQYDNVTVALTDKEEVRAIAGPEPENPMEALKPHRKDEPRALVAAAEQYAARHDALEHKYNELVALGMTVDKEKFLSSVTLPLDMRLESIALVLPYIRSMERSINNLSPQTTKSETRELEQRLSAQREYVKQLEDDLRKKDVQIKGKGETIALLQRELAEAKSALRVMGISTPQHSATT